MDHARKDILPPAPPPTPELREWHFRDLLDVKRVKNKRSLWLAGAAVVLAAAGIGALFLFTEFDWDHFTRTIARLNPVAILPMMALLPVVGFPISVVYLVAGARFGPLLGGVVVAGATAVHLLASYFIGRSILRGPVERFIERRGYRVPQVPADEHAAVSLIVALVPGLPYAVRNYLLVLAGVRLKIFFGVCLPVYVARSYVTILLGDLTSDPSGRGLMILLAFDALKIGICAVVIWRLRVHHRRFHGPAVGADARPSGAAP